MSHNTHCNQGEYAGSCKYGEADSCPALHSKELNIMADQLKAAALALYKPPFKFESGYFFDADGNMVADKHEAELMRVRGWGRISYKDNPEALQDMVGALIAEAMTAAWNTRAEPASVPTVQAGDGKEWRRDNSTVYTLNDRGFNHDSMSIQQSDGRHDRDATNELAERVRLALNATPSQPVVGKEWLIEFEKRIHLYGRACNQDGNPAWESDAGKSLREHLLTLTTANAGKDQS